MPQIATRAFEDAAAKPETPLPTSPPDLSQDIDIALAIDVTAAAIVAASPLARDALGLSRAAALPIAVDSAMPALRRLRAIAAGAGPNELLEPLDFWSLDGRLVSRLWRVAALIHSAAPTLMLIRSALGDLDGFGDSILNAERPSLDDAATLKEIARQIREGQFEARTPAASSAPMQDDPVAGLSTPLFEAPSPPVSLAPLPLRAAASSMTPEYLARLAHELKTPLTAIAAASEVMRDERLGEMGNDRYLDYARDIHESAAHALAVIARLLSRGEPYDAESNRTTAVDLNSLVARTVATLQPIAAEREITLAFDADEGTPIVRASATALRQILLNLLSNALKFTPARGDVRAATGYLHSGAAYLVVRDTGQGIDESSIKRALDFAAAPIAERNGGGYGIGLPLVCRLVADMRAEIEFDSEPGRGTVVLISFGGRRAAHS